MSDHKLTKKDILRTALRHYLGVTTFNYDTGIAPTIVWELFPALRKIYANDDDLVLSLDNHFRYYNCNPWLSPLITGATLAMEEKDGVKSIEAVQNLKTGLMGPLSGIGDTIIWVMMPTIFGAIAGSMGKKATPGYVAISSCFSHLLFLKTLPLFCRLSNGNKSYCEIRSEA
ncbi:PTS system mannose/fructose/sorbose family transporter subunit IID [Lactobacillus sp. R2/2]|nr:PTS system mannose/fructose/sorbose family transporter subunit IID [Lactobacillus sp. R2/2]